MKHFSLFLACTAACGIYSLEASAANNKKKERPNILWVTFEDTSSYEFGCYGNKDVHTPNADSLAAQGIQFMNAWSVAPQSSPARSSLITGCYAPTYGMDVHPVSYDTPADIFFHKDCAKQVIIVLIIARRIITLPTIIKLAGTSVPRQHLTTARKEAKTNRSSLCSIP